MSDFLKSLLDKNTGSQTGELIGAFLSNRNKKDNRARNVLLASLFFNAKEANMQGKVLKNLKELDNDLTFKLNNASYVFDNKLKLQNQYDEIQKSNPYQYYNADADKAFYSVDAHRRNKNFYDNEDSGYAAKEKWKEDWSNEQYKIFLNSYDKSAPRLTTLENFQKDIQNYYKAKKDDIANPRNVSLVHKAFGWLPGAKERDKKLATDVKTTASNAGINLETGNFEAKSKYNKNLVKVIPTLNKDSQLQIASFPSSIDKGEVKINPENIRELLVDDYGTDIQADIRNYVQNTFQALPEKDQTYKKYLSISQSALDNRFVINTNATIKEVTAKYDSVNPKKLEDGSSNPNYDEKELNRIIREKLEIDNLSDEIYESSNEFANLLAQFEEFKTPEEKKDFIDTKVETFVESQVNRLSSVKDKSGLFDSYRETYLIELGIEKARNKNVWKTTPITRKLIVNSSVSKDTIDYLNENKFDVNSYVNAPEDIKVEIERLQQEQWDINSIEGFENLIT
mgnify:CR=1 FL=1